MIESATCFDGQCGWECVHKGRHGHEGREEAAQRWPEALKREIVAATSKPGASVSMVARRYDVNANQVFSWRRRCREASEPSPASLPTPRLLPLTIAPAPEDEPATPSTPAASDTIEIEVSGTYRVRVGSGFDPRSLKHVLDVLRRR